MRTIIIITWKKKSEGNMEAYTTLKDFLHDHPVWPYSTVMNYLSREKKPFEDETVRIERIELKKGKGVLRAKPKPKEATKPKKAAKRKR